MDEKLSERCQSVADQTAEALAWLGEESNRERVGAAKAGSIERVLRRSGARAQKLATAARRNMCVGVFGPSQAGKSFLVSVLARPEGGKLTADFDDPNGRKDFISEINPPGEGESTGLVTRFTMRRDPCPAGFPIPLRLLSEADLARVLANTFLMDGDQSEEPPVKEEIDDLVATYGARKGAGKGLSADEVWDIQEYFEKGFSRSAYVAGLKYYWEKAAEIAPALALPDRAAFFAVLWGRHAFFTELYVRLARALETLGHAGEVFASMDALVPREASIIDVRLLAGLDEEGPQDQLALRTATGITASLPKAIVTALTAELIIPMAEQPWDIFAQTDLLDFPGARARFTNNIEKTFKTADTPRKDTFLRGKVAYLFDRYVAEQELTSMLLCIPPSNMEVTDLPGLVADWVQLTHGATPAERARIECILFFVFTKFDMHLPDNATTGTDPVMRWDLRVEASMSNPFGKLADSWVNDWADGRPFGNSYWLRNPNYPIEAFINYEDGVEVEVRPEKAARIEELREGCLSARRVQRHFADPARAWKAAMELNDGGVGYLVEMLRPVCRPEIKSRQVGAQLALVCETVTLELKAHHVSDDLEQRLEEKRAAADEIVGAAQHVLEQNRFGEMLEALMVDPNRIADRIGRLPDNLRIVTGGSASAPAGGAGPRPVPPGGARPRPVLPGAAARAAAAPAAAVAPAAASVPLIRTITREAFQAESALQTWIETMEDFINSPELPGLFGMAPGTARVLANELNGAAARLGLQRAIQEELPAWNFALSNDELSGPVSVIAAERINRFVARLGVDALPEAKRPQIPFDDGSSQPVFQPKPVRFAVQDLPQEPRNDAEWYYADWVTTLYAVIEANAYDMAGPDFDQEQNARLGAILKKISEAA